jgi:hypothetical protein
MRMTNLKGFGRKWSWHNFKVLRYYHCICLERLRKTTKSLSQDSQSPGQDMKLRPPKNEAGVHKFITLFDTIMGDHMETRQFFDMLSPSVLWTAYDASFKFKVVRYKKHLISVWHPRNTLFVGPACGNGGYCQRTVYKNLI